MALTQYLTSYSSPTKLREGNVFTGACLFTGRVSLVSYPFRGRASSGWLPSLPLEGLPLPEGLPRKVNGMRSASRRYASYWNVFLFTLFVQNHNTLKNTSTFEINPNIHLNHYVACLKEEYDTILHNRFFVFLLTDPSLILWRKEEY